ncbi:MAG: hypothetical protein LC745_03665 [Planctomycetia bacterium]|nr:hypothetical protein [Planctomycetia bacterium]
MAAANESQGLKIAVAIFVTLTVILAVSTYFSYSEYSKADAQKLAAEAKSTTANKAALDAISQAEALRKDIGVREEDPEAVKTAIKNEHKKVDEKLKSMIDQVNSMVAKAQASGAQGPELDDAKAKSQQIAAAYLSEPNKTYISALDRLTDLLKNLTLLTTQLSLNYVDVKRNLENANGVNDLKRKVDIDAFAGAKSDLSKEIARHESERQSILARIDQFQSENAKMATEIQNLTTKMRRMEDDSSKAMALAQQTIRDLRDRAERKETILDRPDGQITFVDYKRNEIHTNVSRAMGARPQMKFTIFDSHSPGIPTDKPKGTVELISVGDRESIGRIVKTNNTIEPLRVGDYVYSPAWSANDPMKFALIGRIDINRDGRDDREDLKRMIEAAGGKVDYDLPPPDAGRETGKLTGGDAWYVIDERGPLNEVYSPSKSVTANENAEFLRKQSEAIREARLNGVRPMPIERLLPFLGYDYLAPIRGRAEAIDLSTLKRTLAPRQQTEAVKPNEAAPKDEK